MSPPLTVAGLQADARAVGERLEVTYALRADAALLRIPAPSSALRRDELWRHTCFELFVMVAAYAGAASSHNYTEYNFSPSTEWAAYRFAAYRQGPVALAAERVVPQISVQRAPAGLDLIASINVPEAAASLRIGLCAVVEDRDGRLSYWALAHPDLQRPDFHDQRGFVLEVRH